VPSLVIVAIGLLPVILVCRTLAARGRDRTIIAAEAA
jgi:hypothetical protein